MLLRKSLWDVKHYHHLDDCVYEVNEWGESEFLVESQKTSEETERNEKGNRRENRLFILCYSSCSMSVCSRNDNFFYLVSWLLFSSLVDSLQSSWIFKCRSVVTTYCEDHHSLESSCDTVIDFVHRTRFSITWYSSSSFRMLFFTTLFISYHKLVVSLISHASRNSE